jgi:hypothetical protein
LTAVYQIERRPSDFPPGRAFRSYFPPAGQHFLRPGRASRFALHLEDFVFRLQRPSSLSRDLEKPLQREKAGAAATTSD